MSDALQWSLPADWYWREDVHQRELERIFRREWHWIGLETDVARPGQFVRSEVAGHDIVVVRTDRGLRAWHNVCRHRGSKLVTASGRCDAFACPYHGWRYGLDGTLIATPRFEGVDPTAHGLVEAARVDTWMGLVS
jgi:phenylpropionate dioxygenase-like ring-hydroxylating dioxygenase large terminal subunit